jgi:hypothetical protein
MMNAVWRTSLEFIYPFVLLFIKPIAKGLDS